MLGARRERIRLVERPTCGITASQIPLDSRAASGDAPGRQPFQSPVTDTARAFGAQTAKYVPPSTTCAPSFS